MGQGATRQQERPRLPAPEGTGWYRSTLGNTTVPELQNRCAGESWQAGSIPVRLRYQKRAVDQRLRAGRREPRGSRGGPDGAPKIASLRKSFGFPIGPELDKSSGPGEPRADKSAVRSTTPGRREEPAHLMPVSTCRMNTAHAASIRSPGTAARNDWKAVFLGAPTRPRSFTQSRWSELVSRYVYPEARHRRRIHVADLSSDVTSATGPRCISLSGLTIALKLVI